MFEACQTFADHRRQLLGVQSIGGREEMFDLEFSSGARGNLCSVLLQAIEDDVVLSLGEGPGNTQANAARSMKNSLLACRSWKASTLCCP